MDALSIFALLILIMIAVLIGAAIWFLGSLPGKVAVERNHPYATAIQVGGWATLFLGVVFWPLVLMWAYSASNASPTASAEPHEEWKSELSQLKTRVEALAAQVQKPGGKT